jgi:uncharacterized protein
MKISPNKIYIDNSPVGGRGVFAKASIKKNEVVETAPYIVINDSDCTGELENYEFGHSKGKNIFCLGYGAMYNHSKDSNLIYRYSDKLESCVDYVATRSIKKNEELFIDYGEDWWNGRDEKEF